MKDKLTEYANSCGILWPMNKLRYSPLSIIYAEALEIFLNSPGTIFGLTSSDSVSSVKKPQSIP